MDRPRGSESTFLDPSQEISKSQFLEKSTTNKNKELTDPNQEKSKLTDLEGYGDTFEGGDRSGGSELTLLDPKHDLLHSQFSNDRDKELTNPKQEKSNLTNPGGPCKGSDGGDQSRGSELTFLDPSQEISKSQF